MAENADTKDVNISMTDDGDEQVTVTPGEDRDDKPNTTNTTDTRETPDNVTPNDPPPKLGSPVATVVPVDKGTSAVDPAVSGGSGGGGALVITKYVLIGCAFLVGVGLVIGGVMAIVNGSKNTGRSHLTCTN